MVLEALAEPERRPKIVLDILDRWGQELTELKKTHAEDPECTNALESVERELIFRAENSIRNQIRTLVKTTLSQVGDADGELTAKRAVKIYDQRSTLVHEGTLDAQQLAECFTDVRSIVERVLRARIKTIVRP